MFQLHLSDKSKWSFKCFRFLVVWANFKYPPTSGSRKRYAFQLIAYMFQVHRIWIFSKIPKITLVNFQSTNLSPLWTLPLHFVVEFSKLQKNLMLNIEQASTECQVMRNFGIKSSEIPSNFYYRNSFSERKYEFWKVVAKTLMDEINFGWGAFISFSNGNFAMRFTQNWTLRILATCIFNIRVATNPRSFRFVRGLVFAKLSICRMAKCARRFSSHFHPFRRVLPGSVYFYFSRPQQQPFAAADRDTFRKVVNQIIWYRKNRTTKCEHWNFQIGHRRPYVPSPFLFDAIIFEVQLIFCVIFAALCAILEMKNGYKEGVIPLFCAMCQNISILFCIFKTKFIRL